MILCVKVDKMFVAAARSMNQSRKKNLLTEVFLQPETHYNYDTLALHTFIL